MPVIGSIVVVESGLIHVTGRVMDVAGEGRLWLDCNIIGSHLPQMYRAADLVEVQNADGVAGHGMCPPCLGFGLVEHPEGEVLCPTCGGSGRSGVKVEITDTGSGSETRMQWDPAFVDGIACELCRAAFIPT